MRLFKRQSSSVCWPLCDNDTLVAKESEPTDDDDLVLDLGGNQNPLRY